MEQFYDVVVAVKYEDDKGKVKTRRENYLVSAVSCLDAETKATKHLGQIGETGPFIITSVKEKKYVDVVR